MNRYLLCALPPATAELYIPHTDVPSRGAHLCARLYKLDFLTYLWLNQVIQHQMKNVVSIGIQRHFDSH